MIFICDMIQIKKNIFLVLIFATLLNFCKAQDNFVQSGVATYYSDAFQGRHTTSGERYDKNLFTAAHATLPFHTMVKVTNLKNNKYVIVKINDRCPKYYNRIIDLSKAAARQLDILLSGIASVKLEVITPNDLNYLDNAPDSLFQVISKDTSLIKGMLLCPRGNTTTIDRQMIRNYLFSRMLVMNYRKKWKIKNEGLAFSSIYLLKLTRLLS
jgi:rare lipoprotein A